MSDSQLITPSKDAFVRFCRWYLQGVWVNAYGYQALFCEDPVAEAEFSGYQGA